jgi:hypothetical protein
MYNYCYTICASTYIIHTFTNFEITIFWDNQKFQSAMSSHSGLL